jgi:glycosyltransferase involved in cell wall biosynthesis
MKLSIFIPTYNRHEELTQLWETFLSRVKIRFTGSIEIIILDNSDEFAAYKNEFFFRNKNISYIKNNCNITN